MENEKIIVGHLEIQKETYSKKKTLILDVQNEQCLATEFFAETFEEGTEEILLYGLYQENYTKEEQEEIDNTEYDEDELWIAVPPITEEDFSK